MRLGCLASESFFDGAGGVWAASGVCGFDVDSWLCVGGTTARSDDCGCCACAEASPGPPIRAVQTNSDRAKHAKAFVAWAMDMIFKDLPSSDAFTTSSVPLEDLSKLEIQRKLNLGAPVAASGGPNVEIGGTPEPKTGLIKGMFARLNRLKNSATRSRRFTR